MFLLPLSTVRFFILNWMIQILEDKSLSPIKLPYLPASTEGFPYQRAKCRTNKRSNNKQP